MSESQTYEHATESEFTTKAGKVIRVPRLNARSVLKVSGVLSDNAPNFLGGDRQNEVYGDSLLTVVDIALALPIEGFPQGRNIDNMPEVTAADIVPLGLHILEIEGLVDSSTEKDGESGNEQSPGTPQE